MAFIELRAAAQQALEACKLIVSAFDALKPASAARNEPLQINAARASITALEAALAEPQEPGCRDDGMPTSAEERHLRRLLALRAAMPHAYYDDGEAQGTEHGIIIDFMREPVAHIDAKLRALNVARAIAKQAEPVQDHFPDATKMVREPVQAAEMRRCPRCWEPMFPPQPTPLTVARLRDALVSARIVPPAAVEDPDGYDDGVTLLRIEALHRRLA